MLVSLPPLEIIASQVEMEAQLSGSLYDEASETFLRSPAAAAYIHVRLTNETWLLREGATEAIARGFSSSRAESGGWLSQVTPALLEGIDVYVVNSTTLRVGFPQVATYDLLEPESITLTVPGVALF